MITVEFVGPGRSQPRSTVRMVNDDRSNRQRVSIPMPPPAALPHCSYHKAPEELRAEEMIRQAEAAKATMFDVSGRNDFAAENNQFNSSSLLHSGNGRRKLLARSCACGSKY